VQKQTTKIKKILRKLNFVAKKKKKKRKKKEKKKKKKENRRLKIFCDLYNSRF
jgi:hypothetical protein